MRQEGKVVSVKKLCFWFGFARSSFYYRPKKRGAYSSQAIDRAFTQEVRQIIEEYPSYGLRRITAVLKKRLSKQINRKKVHRILKVNGWQIRKKAQGKRPRALGLRSVSTIANQRWSIDTTHVFCGQDGWCHFTAVIDCYDRHIVGWRFSKRGIAKVAAGALEDALKERLSHPSNGLTLRSDNGLVFGSKEFVKVVKRWRLSQEYITPYTPEQNGMIERFFRTLKEECIWQHQFRSQDEAFKAIADFLDVYHKERPHSALGYLTPEEFRLKQVA